MGRRRSVVLGRALATGLAVVLLPPAPVGATAGDCLTVSTAWTAPPVVHPGKAGTTACVGFDGRPGDVVWPVSDGSGAGRVVDADGVEACTPVGERACRLTGPAPYSFRTTGTGQPYRVAVRDVSGATGCPEVRPTPFGTQPPADGPGCARLVAPRAAAYVVGGRAAVLTIGGADLDCPPAADGPAVCAPDGTDHLLVTDPLGRAPGVVVHRLDGPGCDTRVGPSIASQLAGRTAPGTVGCATLAHPRDAVVDVVGDLGRDRPTLSVVDARGRTRCSLRPDDAATCTLAGPAPHRVLVTSPEAGRHRFAVPRLDRPSGCSPLPRRADARGQREVVLRLPRGRVAACLTAPSRFLLGTSLYGVQRLAGRSPVRLVARDTSEGTCTRLDPAPRWVVECRSYRPIGRTTTITLSTDGTGGRWRLAHRFITRQD